MPGHKRNKKSGMPDLPYGLDITEIEGFDDLHHARGIIRDAQERAADLYGAQETHFLINGSTAGILSAIAGVTRRGDTILVARNCHKSVYHAIYMNELNPVYLYPGLHSEIQLNTEVSAEDVRLALGENPKIRAVVIVSPTYDGVVSDVEAIARAAHERGIPLIVDEAHGAHFGFHPYFPENANAKGADIVIHSLHKTLPSLTQTALLHMNGTLVDRSRVRRYLHMLQTSSPSYILMAGIDACISLVREQGGTLFEDYVGMLRETRGRLRGLKNLRLVETEHYDCSKIVVSGHLAGISGSALAERLLESYHLQMEMAVGRYVLAMTSIGDTQEGFGRLTEALLEVDEEFASPQIYPGERPVSSPQTLPRAQVVCRSWEADDVPEGERAYRFLSDSVGLTALEYAYLYPPGCPVIVPGERVTQEAADMLQWYQRLGFTIEGTRRNGQIEVWIHG